MQTSLSRAISLTYRAIGVGLGSAVVATLASDDQAKDDDTMMMPSATTIRTPETAEHQYLARSRSSSSSSSSSNNFFSSAFHQFPKVHCEGEDQSFVQKANNSFAQHQRRLTKKATANKMKQRPKVPNVTNDFPNLERHGKESLLRQYLTEQVYNDLKHKKTSNGVTLEDIIRSGVSLPWGARPPRGVAGVYCGDAESYQTFDVLLKPLIQDRHNANQRARLRRHVTNLDFNRLTQEKVDPAGEYILFTRMRLARSLTGFRFAPCIGRGERRQVENLLRKCTHDWKQRLPKGKYVSMMEMSNELHDDLVHRQMIFPDPDEFALAAGLGRDWPDGRGLYCDTWEDDFPRLMIWCNAQDHFWIVSHAKGGDVQSVFTRLSRAVMALETSLKKRGHSFVEDPKLGFLNTSPVDIGTALRASVYVKLVRLGQQPGFDRLLRNLRLEARPFKTSSQRYTGIFDIANAEALGKSEVELINIMIRGVGTLIELEKRLENGEELSYEDIVTA